MELRTQRDITVFLRFPDEQKILQNSSLPADVLWGSFVMHSFLPHGIPDKPTPKDVCWEATKTHDFLSTVSNPYFYIPFLDSSGKSHPNIAKYAYSSLFSYFFTGVI